MLLFRKMKSLMTVLMSLTVFWMTVAILNDDFTDISYNETVWQAPITSPYFDKRYFGEIVPEYQPAENLKPNISHLSYSAPSPQGQSPGQPTK